MTKAHFELYRGGFIIRDWRFRLRGANDDVICVGQGYATRSAAEHGISAVRWLAHGAKVDVRL